MFSKELWCSAVGSTGRSATATAHSISVAYHGDSQSDWCRTRISEYYFLNPNWWHYVASFFDYGILKLAILNHFDILTVWQGFFGLSSEMQPVCPWPMYAKKMRYSLPKLSVGVFRRPYLTGWKTRSMFQCCWTYSCLPARERADTFCRGFVDGVHWLHQYWSITITYFPKTLDSPSCRLLFFAFQWDWCSMLLFTGGSACIPCFVPSQQQHSMVDKSKRVSTSPLSSWRSNFEETRKICAYCIVMHSLHSGIVVKPSTSRVSMIFARCFSFRRGVHGREKQIGSSFCNSSEASHECCSCSKDFKGM